MVSTVSVVTPDQNIVAVKQKVLGQYTKALP